MTIAGLVIVLLIVAAAVATTVGVPLVLARSYRFREQRMRGQHLALQQQLAELGRVLNEARAYENSLKLALAKADKERKVLREFLFEVKQQVAKCLDKRFRDWFNEQHQQRL